MPFRGCCCYQTFCRWVSFSHVASPDTAFHPTTFTHHTHAEETDAFPPHLHQSHLLSSPPQRARQVVLGCKAALRAVSGSRADKPAWECLGKAIRSLARMEDG